LSALEVKPEAPLRHSKGNLRRLGKLLAQSVATSQVSADHV